MATPGRSPKTASAARAPWLAIGLLSGAALAYEILLTRLFAITQWHHFAYMIISLALLGYGASGTFLALLGKRLVPAFPWVFTFNAAVFGVSSIAGFLLVQQLPFSPLEIAWDAGQLAYLSLIYLILAVPFFAVANCIGTALWRFPRHLHRVYATDLVGAGTGALSVPGLLYAATERHALLALGLAGLAAAAVATLEMRMRQRWAWGGLPLLGLAVWLAIPQGWTSLQLSEYKGLAQTMQVTGAEHLLRRSGPLGRIDVVRNTSIPFHYAPGMSLAATDEPPEQLALFSDGEEIGAINRFDGLLEPLGYLDFLTSALSYHLLEEPHVAVLGAGGGSDVLQALFHGADIVEAVELNPQVTDLLRRDFSDFSGRVYDHPKVRIHNAEARGFVAARRERFDLIQLALIDAFGASSAGLYALSESYLYTVEAFQAYLRHLEAGGLLSITRWSRLPPRDALKLLATARRALEAMNTESFDRRIVMIRGWKTTTLLVKNGPFEAADLEAVREFCRRRSFDLVYAPDIDETETNRYNILRREDYYRGAMALLGPSSEDFIADYKFNITPATDDRPYFFDFSKWRALPELLELGPRGGLAQIDWGYWVLVATLLQALLASLLLILLPLWLTGKRDSPASTGTEPHRWRVPAYFIAIGLAFMFVEIAFIQKFLLFLSHPTYAVAVVLTGFLVFAGLGSAWSGHRPPPGPPRRRTLGWVAACIGAIAVGYILTLPVVFRELAHLPDYLKIFASLLLIAPLAFAMGSPFPLGLSQVSANSPRLVPWAWASNGCASVTGAVLATILAMEFGFNNVILLAIGLYAFAAFSQPTGGVAKKPAVGRARGGDRG